MLTAISNGDWAMVGVYALGFVGGGAAALKVFKVLKGAGKATQLSQNAAKGRAFEEFLMNSKGLSKYKGTPVKNAKGSWRPDFAGYGEAKATKYLSNNRQMRTMCQFARDNPGENVRLFVARSPGQTPHLSEPLLNNLRESGVSLEFVNWVM
jgi:hypothetical protein